MEDTKILLDFDLSRNSALFARESLISLVIIVQHRMEYVFMIILYRMIISSASPRNRIVDRLYPIVWRSEELCSISIVPHFLCYLIFYLFIFSYVMILPFCEEFIFLSLFFHLAKMIFCISTDTWSYRYFLCFVNCNFTSDIPIFLFFFIATNDNGMYLM